MTFSFRFLPDCVLHLQWKNNKLSYTLYLFVYWIWLEISFSCLTIHNPVEIQIKNFFSEIFTFDHISLKSDTLNLAMIMKSPWRHTCGIGTYFGMYQKKRPPILLYHLDVWEYIFKFIRGGNNPSLVRLVKVFCWWY